jgi:uncharacterized protein involved in response to NO
VTLPPILALAFRPFFLAAGIAAIALVAGWLAIYIGVLPGAGYYGLSGWHAHEMLFGYAVAVLGGFLLTAARNWTGVQTARGGVLLGLIALWLAGRLAPLLLPVSAGWAVALIDMALLPALAVAVAVPIVRVRQTRNMVFIVLLALLAVANSLVHAGALSSATGAAHAGLYLAAYTFVLAIVVMGGRVIPSFTERGLPGDVRCRRVAAIELAAPATVVAVAVCELAYPAAWLLTALCAAAALVHALRLAGWYTARYWSVPLLWVLHLGYAWVAVGFALRALAALGWLPPALALHAFTAGAIGVLTLGMMARVALGHTGRPLRVGADLAVAFSLINIAAVVRVLAPLLLPDRYVLLVVLSGALWCAAFALFVARYAPILWQPRIDGKPG